MIRPLTIVTFLLACGSGLYLYQSKHEVQVLDRTIERTVRDTGSLREQSRLLAAEWTMLNDPERLRRFSDTYLSLKTIAPSQFTSLADLGSRLPAPLPEAPAAGKDEPDLAPPVADAEPSASGTGGSVAVAGDLPVPPIPVAVPAPVVALAVRPADTRPADTRPADTRPAEARSIDRAGVSHPVVVAVQARPVAVADSRPADRHPAEQRVADVRPPAASVTRPVALAAQQRPLPVVPQPQPYRQPAQAPAEPSPYGGSLLGMARGSMPPAPRPTPVSATYDSN